MDDEQKRRHLRKADEDIAAAWRRIDEQRDRIAKMATDGHKTETGEALLQTMMDSVHAMEDHRRTILRESAARSRCCTPARAPTGGRLSQRARGRRGDQARGRERGPPLHPDFRGRRRSRVLRDAVARTVTQLGGLDILVNNAAFRRMPAS
jgi:NAD(P)-dependent dehydrogenase (short-subunit alcohol dehydrogenase family)